MLRHTGMATTEPTRIRGRQPWARAAGWAGVRIGLLVVALGGGIAVAEERPTAPTSSSAPLAWAEAAIIGSGGIRGAFGEIITPADLDGMTPFELEAASASGAFHTGWGLYCRSTMRPGRT